MDPERDKALDNRQTVTQGQIARMMYEQQCPVGYHCQASDCMECLEIYMDGESADSKI